MSRSQSNHLHTTSPTQPPSRHGRDIQGVELLDRKLHGHVGRYVLQSGLAAMAIALILLVFDIRSQTALVASLGASAFVAFTFPHTKAATVRCLVGGYCVGIGVGAACCYVGQLPVLAAAFETSHLAQALFWALAVGAAMFLMVITNTEHAPAAGITLGMMINEWDLLVVVHVLLGVCLLSLVRVLLKPVLRNL